MSHNIFLDIAQLSFGAIGLNRQRVEKRQDARRAGRDENDELNVIVSIAAIVRAAAVIYF